MPTHAPTPRRDWSDDSNELSRLMAQTGLGDRAAFSQLYDRTSAHLYGVVLRITRDRSAAEDVLQEVYVNVWRAARGFDPAQSQPLTWLTSVARNRAIDGVRRAQSRPAVAARSAQLDAESDTQLEDTIADEGPGPLQLLTRAAEARSLADCMQVLSPAQRQSVALAFFDGLTHAEVAVSMGEPLGTVKSWVRRALLALRVCLERAAVRETGAGMGAGATVAAAAGAGAVSRPGGSL